MSCPKLFQTHLRHWEFQLLLLLRGRIEDILADKVEGWVSDISQSSGWMGPGKIGRENCTVNTNLAPHMGLALGGKLTG